MVALEDLASSLVVRRLPGRMRRTFRSGGWRALAQDSVSVLRARWGLRSAELSGAPRLWGGVRVHGRGRVVIGDRVRLEGIPLRIDLFAGPGAVLTIGEGTYINYGVSLGATERMTIGRECAIGQLVIVADNDFHVPGDHWRMGESQPVVIEDRVWIGAHSIVLRGVRIGQGSVIGANSVVTGDIPPGVVAAGAPARVIRKLETDQ